MRAHIVKSIFKKELIDILRDKKTLFMTVILPILLYPVLIFLMMYIMNASSTSMAQKELAIAFSEVPNSRVMEKIEALTKEDGKLKIVEVTDYKKAIEDKKISAYVEVIQSDKDVDYKIYVNSSIEDDNEAADRIKTILREYKEELVKEGIIAAGLDAKEILEPINYEVVDVAEKEQVVGYFLGTILPFILIVGILSGAVYPAIDIMAGEKERGTLETLLTLPITNLELVIGKYLAVALSTIVTALLSVLSILFSMVFIFLSNKEMMAANEFNFDVSQLAMPLVITLVCLIIFSMIIAAVSMCVCSLAKSFKEAQNATTPIMLIGMILSYSSMIPNVELNSVTANIPVVNVVLLIKSVLTFRYNVSLMAMVMISNVVFVMLSVWLLSKLFNSEEVLFGNGKGFSFLEKRSNIKKGTMPTISDGIMVYGVALLLLLYVGSYIQLKFGLPGLLGNQIIFVILPVLLSIYIKTDLKKVYSLNIPSIKSVLGAVSLWAGIFIIMNLISALLIFLFPQNQEVAEGLSEIIVMKEHFILNLLIVAVAPAIGEEILFRGFIFSSFKGEKSYKRAIIVSGVLFGLMHIDFIRIIPTTCLGIVIAYAVYKSGSIFVGMLMHFLNNGLLVASQHFENGMVAEVFKYLEIDFGALQVSNLLILIGTSLALIVIGVALLKWRKQELSHKESPVA